MKRMGKKSQGSMERTMPKMPMKPMATKAMAGKGNPMTPSGCTLVPLGKRTGR